MSPLANRVVWENVRLWTWEVVTGFEAEPNRENLQKNFAEDFPDCSNRGKPIFKKMFSFNGAEGRRHLFLVTFQKENLTEGRLSKTRMLPSSLCLYGRCDRLLRQGDCFGNLRYGCLWEGTLFILVFIDGRLCFWSEEPYHDSVSAVERLNRFDEFLKRDEFFSRYEETKKIFEQDEFFFSQNDLEIAIKDHFWKDFNLYKTKKKGNVKICLMGGVLIAGITALIFFHGTVWRRVECFDGLQRNVEEETAKNDGKEIIKNEFIQNENERPLIRVPRKRKAECEKIGWRVKGMLENKIAQIEIPGAGKYWVKPNGVVKEFSVLRIERDKLVLACRGREYVLENGR